MEPKQICYDHEQSSSSLLSASYESFIARNLESLNSYRINELYGRRVRGCYHGWVILSDLNDCFMWSLWNPQTSNFIRLPPLTHMDKTPNYCCFTSSPDDDGGSIFFFTIASKPSIVFCRLDLEKLEWAELSYAKQLTNLGSPDDGCFLVDPTCCNGKVYAMGVIMDEGYHLTVIQVDFVVKGSKEVEVSLQPFLKLPDATYRPLTNTKCMNYSFLKGSCTEFFYINLVCWYESRTGYFSLFKLDMASMLWEEIEDLKDATFVLDCGISNMNLVFYQSKVSSDIAGYVHCFSDMDTIITSFHVKDKTMFLSSASSSVRESQLLVWTMLECGLEANSFKSKQEEENKDRELVVQPIKVKGDEPESEIATRESHLLNLPFHMLETIMELCVGVEYLKFRATCKHCSLAAPSIQRSNKTALRRLQLSSLDSPWLMVLDIYRGIITFIDPLYGDSYFIKTPQDLKGNYQIYQSRFGWLLMCKKDGPLVFFNPFTSDIHELPFPENHGLLDCFCFSAPPTSPDCMVVGFSRWHVYIRAAYGESLWRLYRFNFSSDISIFFSFPTFCGQNVYALWDSKRLEAFKDIAEGCSCEVVVDNAPESSCRSPTQYFLSNCDQHVLLVIVGDLGGSVEVFSLNDSTKEWEKTHNLGKHVIYITNTSCICLEAKSPEMENKIYFPWLLENENAKIVCYSLETCRYHTFNDKIIQESLGNNLLRAKYQCFPHTWIEPSWS